MLAAGTAAGVFEPEERRMAERVFRLDDEPIAAMMTPRRDIVWLDIADAADVHRELIRQHPYSRFPVCDGDLDQLIGMVSVRDLWIAEGQPSVPADLRAIVRQPLLVPERLAALEVLNRFQSTGTHVAIVIDEHGSVDGMVTLNNILQFLVSTPAGGPARKDEPAIVSRGPDSWLVDGSLSVGEFYAAVGIDDPDADHASGYHTVAGLVLTALQRVPTAGDRVTVGQMLLEVVDMDGLRVDKVLAVKLPAESGPTEYRGA